MDAALVEAVAHTTGPARVDLLDALLARRHAPSLAKLVACYGSGSAVLDQLLVDRVREVESGLRIAAGAEAAAMRASALALIVEANDCGLAYILAEAIGHVDEQTRKTAGDGLHVLTTRFLHCRALDQLESKSESYDQQEKQLTSALGYAIQRWEHHTHRACLASAMWMGLGVRDAIAKKLDQPRNGLRVSAERMLDQTKDPRLAGFALAALSIAPLRTIAARTIGLSGHAQFIDAVIRQAPLLQDEAVRRGCRWIKKTGWLSLALERLLCRGDNTMVGAIGFLSACGAPVGGKMRLYRRLLDEGTPSVRRLALEALEQDLGGAARGLLTALAIRSGDDLAELAHDMLKDKENAGAPETVPDRGHGLVDRYFKGETPLSKVDRVAMGRALGCEPGGALVALRARLASLDALDKARALHLARVVGLIPELTQQVHRLVHDSDPTVRSVAVAMLVLLPSPTSQRLARAAVDDNDDRVRAGGVEAMDELDVPNRADCTQPLLISRSQRLRANAVKSLLTLSDPRAGESLLDMLADPSPAHRMSALWVADRLHLRSVASRVQALATGDKDDRVRHRASRVLDGLTKSVAPHASGSATAPIQPIQGGGVA